MPNAIGARIAMNVVREARKAVDVVPVVFIDTMIMAVERIEYSRYVMTCILRRGHQ